MTRYKSHHQCPYARNISAKAILSFVSESELNKWNTNQYAESIAYLSFLPLTPNPSPGQNIATPKFYSIMINRSLFPSRVKPLQSYPYPSHTIPAPASQRGTYPPLPISHTHRTIPHRTIPHHPLTPSYPSPQPPQPSPSQQPSSRSSTPQSAP